MLRIYYLKINVFIKLKKLRKITNLKMKKFVPKLLELVYQLAGDYDPAVQNE